MNSNGIHREARGKQIGEEGPLWRGLLTVAGVLIGDLFRAASILSAVAMAQLVPMVVAAAPTPQMYVYTLIRRGKKQFSLHPGSTFCSTDKLYLAVATP